MSDFLYICNMNTKGNLFLKAKKVVIDNKHKCYNCGSKFTPARGSIKRGWGMFCSRSCASKWTSKEKSTDEIRDFKLCKILR